MSPEMEERKTLRSDLHFLLFAVLVGFLLRFDYLNATNFLIDADEAIVGLMGKHILEGVAAPVFYYGQHYMGSLEAFLAAAAFAVLGMSNAALKAVPLVFSLSLIPLVYIISLRLGGRFAARVGALLMAVPPTGLVIWSSKARGGFMEVIFFGALALYLMLGWYAVSRPAKSRTFLVAVILGFGWWINNQIVYFIAPLALFALLKLTQGREFRELSRHFSIGVLGFFIGGLPYWIYNLEHDFASFGIFHRAEGRNISKHIFGFFNEALPALLGAKRFWHDEAVFSGAVLVVYCVYAALFATLLYARRKQVLNLLRGRIDSSSPVELLFAILLFGSAVFVSSSFGHLSSEPRYLLPLYVALFSLTGVAVAVLAESYPGFAAGAFAILLTLNIASSFWGGRVIAGQPFVYKGERVSKDHGELLNWLEQNGYDFVRANYWIGYRLAFESAEKVKFGPLSPLETVRIKDYERLAETKGLQSIPFVLVPSQAQIFELGLKDRGYAFTRQQISNYIVLSDIHPKQTGLKRVARELFEVRADAQAERARFAADGDLHTRWGSGEHQKPGVKFYIDLMEPLTLRGIEYDLSEWAHDFPRGLRIELRLVSGELKEIYRTHNIDELSFIVGKDRDLSVYFDPIEVQGVVLTQLGNHPLFDWSIAELYLWQ